ncbi:TPM domain-containing protein [Paenibacillus sp. FSL R7-0331]|uniref:TPM domain-containing protein n=1 Tax=Paenibacillus sp. FSL R7-0331 TaxID=1536773 RepID=UPI00069414BC|nr:TPM domain-containing protein [Paenibacillus sp. FSL R7-0331]
MKHKGIIVMLVAMLLSVMLLPEVSRAKPAVPEHTDAFYVNDFAGVIDLKAENYMVNYGVKLHQETGAQVVLVTVDSTGGATMEEYAKTLFNSWGIGSADKDNGVLLLLSIKDDDYWVLQGDGLKSSLTDSMLSQILAQSLEPDFARKEYAAGARKTYGALIESLGGVWTEPLGTRNFVADNAGVLPQVTRLYLNQSSNRYKTTTGSGVYFVTVKNSGSRTLQDYTYAKYASVGAGPRDVMLVLDIEGDNYHVLQGKDVDTTLTNEVIGDILSRALEPQFAAQKYAAGVTAAANEIFSFFLARADHSPAAIAPQEAAGTAAAGVAGGVTNKAVESGEAVVKVPERISRGKGFAVIGIFLGIVGLISLAASRRNSYIARYGLPVNPYSRRNIRRYGVWQGQPGYGYGSRWYNRRHRPRRSSASHRRSSFWETNHGGGGSSSGGGAGRYTGSETNHGGGGYSSGGGSGRHSSRSSNEDRSSSSSSGSSSGGGGNASRGGGVGRHS